MGRAPENRDPAELSAPGSPVSELSETTGAQLRRLRVALGLTLREAATRTGVSFQMLGQIENGTNTTIDKVEQIARAYAATAQFLIGEPPAPSYGVDGPRRGVAERFLRILPHIPDDELDVFVHELALWERRYQPRDGG